MAEPPIVDARARGHAGRLGRIWLLWPRGRQGRRGGAGTGPRFAARLRLRVSTPCPDFDLRVAPSSVNASGGATVPLTVTAIRRDGFAFDIALALKNAPGRFMLSGGVIPAGEDQARVRASFPPAYRLFQHLELELSEPPDGVTLSDLRLIGNGAEFVLQAAPAKIKAGRRGNLIVIVSGQRTPAATAQQPTPVSRPVPLGALPATSFEIVER
jgi:hypothetical protein